MFYTPKLWPLLKNLTGFLRGSTISILDCNSPAYKTACLVTKHLEDVNALQRSSTDRYSLFC